MQSQLESALTPEKLLKRWRQMIGKAPGPDAWKAFGCKYCAPGMSRINGVRLQWSYSPRMMEGVWPLSLTACVWRIGASVLVHALAPWTTTWADDAIMGGIPRWGVLDARSKLLAATAHDDGIFVSEDLAQLFYTIDINQASQVLAHLGAPTCFVTLISNFCFTSPRIFLDRGICSASGTLPPED